MLKKKENDNRQTWLTAPKLYYIDFGAVPTETFYERFGYYVHDTRLFIDKRCTSNEHCVAGTNRAAETWTSHGCGNDSTSGCYTQP